MIRKLAAYIGGMTALALVLAACSSGNTTPSGSGASQAPKELIYATVKDINDMNPHLYAGSLPAQGMLYESLVEKTEEGIKPLLAESWKISDDGKVYTFQLRKHVKFHDGEPFNADAVKKNIEAVQRNPSRHTWIKLSTKITAVTAVDEHTVQLTLSEPYFPTLLELSMTRPYVFLSPKSFKNGETKDGVNGFNGTGPYKLTEHKTDQYAVFEANESYWGGAPKIKKLTAKVLPTGETTFLALKKGEVHMVFTDDRGTDSLDVEAMKQLADTSGYQIVRSKPMNTKMLIANSSKKDHPIHEKAVREAIWHSIDRDLISKQIFHGTETPANTLFASNVEYANVDLKKRSFDLEAAKKVLDGVGWVLENGQTVRSKGGKKLILKLHYDTNSSSQKTQAELFQSSLKKIGVQLDLAGEESTSIANRRSSGDYELLFNQTWGLAYDPQSTIAAFTSKSSYLHTTSGIAKAEELYKKIDQVTVAMDEKTRKALYADILTIVHDEAVFIPITNGNVTIVAPKSLKGITFKQTQFELPFERFSFQ